ncbi:transposase, partial [Thiotrichales bacterium 19S11-10]|nr:transposase [Thiotrichales bacterium 19S11-10]
RQQHKDVLKYYWKGVLWSPSYFSGSCGGAPITVIRKYIEQQQSPH